MKIFGSFLLILACLFIFGLPNRVFCEEITTLILVRHAEKTTESQDPALTEEGQQRAIDLAYALNDVPIDAIYSTPLRRTQQTAGPTAKAKSLKIITKNPKILDGYKEFIGNILKTHKGSTILIVGHSNTIPIMLKIILGENVNLKNLKYLDDKAYDNIFIASILARGNARITTLKFGKPTPVKNN